MRKLSKILLALVVFISTVSYSLDKNIEIDKNNVENKVNIKENEKNNEKFLDENKIYVEFIENENLENNNYIIGNTVIEKDIYGMIASNIDKLDAEYIVSDKVFDMNINDNLEGFNRRAYAFNMELDKKVLYPASLVYKKVVPEPVRKGITNFYNNFEEIPTFVNSLLQLRVDKAMNALGRFTLNSTLGVAGIVDVAKDLGLKKDKETMGDTLGTYGVKSGSYLVVPVLGPSNIRDSIGSVVDTAITGKARKEIFEYPVLFDNGVNKDIYGLSRILITGLNTRSGINFKYGDLNSPFEYDLVKILYSNFRKIQIAK